MAQSNAFHRSRTMMAAIAMIMASADNHYAQIATLGECKSRGHGGKHKPKGRFLGDNYRYNRSKYSPHVGAKELAKAAQRAAAFAV